MQLNPRYVINIKHRLLSNYIPKHKPPSQFDITRLEHFIGTSSKILVLTGAGISTESGIPDYRSEEVGLYARTNHKPIQHQEFMKSSYIRQRYWARNYIGWPKFSKTQPNRCHYSLRNLEVSNKIRAIITQNVDNLHHKAGSENIIELHGSAYRVVCLSCGKFYDRYDLQSYIAKSNPNMNEIATMIRPDGDVEIPEDKIRSFNTPLCWDCGGILKPDIVFFGDNVPRQRVDKVKQCVTESDSLLVLGSSLTVFSAYRVVLQALEEKKHICIVNIGPTRADKEVEFKINTKCGDILEKIC